MMDFDTFLDATRATLIPGTLPTMNLSIRSHPSSGICVFPYVISVSDYHSCKEKTIKLLSCFYGCHIPQEKLSPLFWQSTSKKKKKTKPPGFSFSSIPLKNLKLHLSLSLQHSRLKMCGYYFFFAEYQLVICL